MNPARPMPPGAAVFYSTIRQWPWGAPDYVWPRAARRLREGGIPVLAIQRAQIWNHPEMRDLVGRGVKLFRQPPLVYRRGLLSEIRAAWLNLVSSTQPLRRALRSLRAPHLLIDQSGAFDFLDDPVLEELIVESEASYDVLFRSNSYFSPLSLEQRQRARRFLGAARRTLFNSEWTREVTETQLAHRLDNASCFTHYVRFEHQKPLPWPADDVIRLASVSRIDCYHKGLDVLLEALAQLPADLPAWTLDIHGSGPDESYLRDLAQFLELGERVRFHPRTEDIRAIWARSHLLVLVSRYEGLGVAMLEAMACGRPVFRTPYGGSRAWVAPEETGYICPAPDAPIIAQSLAAALRDFPRWPAMGRAAHARIAAQLSPYPETTYLEPFGIPPAPVVSTTPAEASSDCD